MSQTPPKTPPQNKPLPKSKEQNKKSNIKPKWSAMTKTFLGLLVIISVGLTIFIVNVWQQLKLANQVDGQLSSGASIEVLTPSGSAPTRNPDGSLFVQQETPTPTIASEASSPAVIPNNNVVIKPVRPAKAAAAPESNTNNTNETPVLPTNVPNNNNDNQAALPTPHKQPKNGVDDLF